MATNLVNLDALIPREDFAVSEKGNDFKRGDTFRITDLVPGAFTYAALRKPDFQRETANWSPQKIQDFVLTYLSGDLVPAIILWGAGGQVFVIDGAHRLSALIAWVHDDYGDGKLSREFFSNDIPPEQLKAAEKTRNLIKKSIGTYVEHDLAAKPNNKASAEVAERALRLSSLALQLQWVPSTDAKRAEASFFRINQAFTEIDPTELRILSARTQPNAVAARAIVRNATGHKYWSAFPDDVQIEIENVAKEIYSTLFTPPLDTPIKTMDVPVAGRGYSAYTLPLMFELVNLANGIPIVDASKKRKKGDEDVNESPDDGTKTLQFLKNTRKLVYRISGTHPSSLGLHPLVYFYSLTGRYQPTAFLAGAAFIRDLDERRKFSDFTSVRSQFEDFFVKYKSFNNQIVLKFGSMAKGYGHIRDLYLFVMAYLLEKKSDEEVISLLKNDSRFNYLLSAIPERNNAGTESANFSKDTKSAAFLREALGNPPVKCSICGGFMHKNSIHIDHDKRKRDGGSNALANAKLAHPYCDSTEKN